MYFLGVVHKLDSAVEIFFIKNYDLISVSKASIDTRVVKSEFKGQFEKKQITKRAKCVKLLSRGFFVIFVEFLNKIVHFWLKL